MCTHTHTHAHTCTHTHTHTYTHTHTCTYMHTHTHTHIHTHTHTHTHTYTHTHTHTHTPTQMWMKPVRRRSRTSSPSTIVPSSSPTRGDASPKSLVVREQERDTRSRTVRLRTSFALHTVYHDGIVMLLHVLIFNLRNLLQPAITGQGSMWGACMILFSSAKGEYAN